MTRIPADESRLELNLVDASPDQADSGLVVERAWLPMVIWEGVKVVVQSTVGLTRMERYVVDCLLTLGHCNAEDLDAVMTLPSQLSDWIFSSLVQKGLAEPVGESFVPCLSACREALERECVMMPREERWAFLWFPETEEAVVVTNADKFLEQIRRIQPAGVYPLPLEQQCLERAQILQDVRRRGRLLGEEQSRIIEISDDESYKTQTCPAYYCRATLPSRPNEGWSLILYDARKRNLGAEIFDLTTYLPLLPGLAEKWRNALQRAGSDVIERLEPWLGSAKFTDNFGRLHCVLRREGVQALPREHLLVHAYGLLVRLDEEIEYAVALQLEPARSDHETVRLFSVDRVVQHVLAERTSAAAATTVCDEAGVAFTDVVDRLWGLQAYRTVYDLRESRDFGV